MSGKTEKVRKYLCRMKGRENCPDRTSKSDMAWSWLGAFIGIMLIAGLNSFIALEAIDDIFLISSFGSSAVLVYGSPDSVFAQPRNLVIGHLLSAIIGVCIYRYIPLDPMILAAIAVSFSLVIMQFTRTLHPPAGATALTAVIGSQQIHNLGFTFIILPVLISALILLIVALLINNLSQDDSRHYPRFWI